MRKPSRSSRARALAAPIVVTAAFTPACSGPVHRNPAPPETAPTAEPEPATLEPTAAPTGSAHVVPTATAADLASLPDPPAGWKLEHNTDGSCTAFPASMECPPTASCNPGPPLRVKCVADAAKPEPKK